MSTVATSVDERETSEQSSRWTSGPAIVFSIAAFMFLVEMLVASRYGYHIDELYLLACSEHLAWGYIDQPPLAVFITYFARHLFGESLFALHILPALSAAALVWTVGSITREMGGRRFAQGLSALAVLATPAYLLDHHILHLVAFEPLLWAGCAYFAVRAIRRKAPENWLWFGAIAGLGLENKYTFAVLLFGLLLGLLLTPARKSFSSWQLWAGAGLALLLFAPNLLWEIVHHFPFLAWRKYIMAHPEVQTFNYSVFDFAGKQVMYTLPVFFLWIAGIWFFLFSARGRQFRFLGFAILVVLGVCSCSGKPYYAIPVYAIAFTGGAMFVESLTEGTERQWLLRSIVIVMVVAAGAILAPCFLPIFPVAQLARYQRSLHLPLPIRSESYESQSEVPSELAWELGWDDMVAKVAQVYNALPDAEKPKTGIVTGTYGEAGAVDLLGKKYGLPKAICGQLSYHDFGTRNYTGEVLITIGLGNLNNACRSVQFGALSTPPYGYGGHEIMVCRGLQFDLRKEWPAALHY